jgi:hypothetical protein
VAFGVGIWWVKGDPSGSPAAGGGEAARVYALTMGSLASRWWTVVLRVAGAFHLICEVYFGYRLAGTTVFTKIPFYSEIRLRWRSGSLINFHHALADTGSVL